MSMAGFLIVSPSLYRDIYDYLCHFCDIVSRAMWKRGKIIGCLGHEAITVSFADEN